ncbi:hypothetical protein [Hymenobacter sp. APR13]|uniref:hypothetical protein n=1 Tax=Hymenobacter sp. APR13 TaxID=1356852 RepID=UPI0004E09254|nr:hypothetical protein [Hymenobacter sp. APR13]AII54322.1 hypothetical protein N008_20335 [Hymenobacter sp. APR13]
MRGPSAKWVGAVLMLAGCLVSGPLRAGGGWIREPGQGYVKLGLTAVGTTRYHTVLGQAVTTARFRQQVYSLYGEMGLLPRLEATLNFPVFRRAEFRAATPGRGVGDPEIGLRYGVLTGQWPLAVGVAVEAPVGNPNERGFNRQDPRIFIALPTGDGEWNVWTRASLSHRLRKQPAYFTLNAGYNKRTEGFTDQYTYGAQVGYQVKGKAWLTANLLTLANTRAPNPDKPGSIGLGEGVAYSTAGLGVSYALGKHWWATADWATGFGTLRNVYSGSQFTAGVAVQW